MLTARQLVAIYRWSKPEEKFRKFMEEYFMAKGCTVKVKLELS